MTERYDVIVAGGGPAGLVAAKFAASEGGKVLLLELQAQIGGQTQSAAWAPKDEVGVALRESVVADVHEIRLHSPHKQITAKGNFGAIVDRRLFDKLLAAEAAASGVEVWVSCPVKELILSDGIVRGVHAEAGAWAERVEGEVVIDATGARGEWSSLFLRKVLKRDWSREQLTLSNEYLMANVVADSAVDLFFASYFAPLGHAWVYPFRGRFAMAGIRGVRIHPDAALDEFMGRQPLPRLEHAVPVASYRGQLPIEGVLDSTCANGIIAVGSSAGQIYVPSGEGLKYALRCGELAGKAAIDAITEGDVSKEALSEYERRWRTEFEAELRVAKLLHTALSVSQDRKMDALFDALATEPKLRNAFMNVFTGVELGKALKVLLANEDVRRVFGSEATSKVLALFK